MWVEARGRVWKDVPVDFHIGDYLMYTKWRKYTLKRPFRRSWRGKNATGCHSRHNINKSTSHKLSNIEILAKMSRRDVAYPAPKSLSCSCWNIFVWVCTSSKPWQAWRFEEMQISCWNYIPTPTTLSLNYFLITEGEMWDLIFKKHIFFLWSIFRREYDSYIIAV